MLKNLKMASKLMLGFGVVLLVFAAAVLTTHRYLSLVSEESRFLSEQETPALRLSAEIERTAYETFLTLHETRFTGTAETMKDDDVKIAVLEKALGDMENLGRSFPVMTSPKMVRENILPVHKDYVTAVRKMQNAIKLRDQSFSEISKAGDTMITNILDAQGSFYKSAVSDNDDTHTKAQRAEQLYLTGQMYGDAMSLRREVMAAQSALDGDAMLKLQDACRELKEKANKAFAAAQSAANKSKMQKVLSALDDYSTELGEMAQDIKAEAEAVLEQAALMRRYNDETSKITGFAEEKVRTVAEENLSSVRSAERLLIVAGAVSVLLGLLIAWFISRSISRPIRTLVGIAKRCQSGDLTVTREDFGYEGKDELGDLVGALSDMVNSQEAAMRQVVSV
ncbi:MAG: HAMP domain-containing protein, partial [Synergistaceae bacterium]|nr:HAMP domain-containing protein [Synergistaceae bacterium]